MEKNQRSSQDPKKPIQLALETLLFIKAQGDDRRRGRLLAALALGSLLGGLAISILNLVQYLAAPGEKYGFYLLGDAAMMALLTGIYLLNRAGQVRAASYIFLPSWILAMTGLIPLRVLDRVLLVYAIPIVAASFLIRPASAFGFALLSAAGYTTVYLTGEPAFSFNYLSMAAMFLIALVFSLAASLVERALRDAQLALKREQDAQSSLRTSEEHYRIVADYTYNWEYWLAPDGKILYMSPSCERTTGYRVGEFMEDPNLLDTIVHPDDHFLFEQLMSLLKHDEGGQGSQKVDFRILRRDGEVRWIEHICQVIRRADGASLGLRCGNGDITERKQAEETLRHRLAELEAMHKVSAALRTAQTRDEALPILLDEMLAALETSAGIFWLYYPDSDELRASVTRGWFSQLLETSMKLEEGIAGAVFTSGRAYLSTEFRSDPLVSATIRAKIPAGWGGACVPVRFGVVMVGVLFVSVPLPRQITPEQVKLLESLAEMAGASLHRMNLYEATVRQLDQLQSIHDIDLAINASMDLRMILNILLSHVLTQLKVDAANVLLLNTPLQTLEYTVAHGFRTNALKNTRLRIGEGYAGRAALERKLVHIPDLRVRKTDFLRSPSFFTEGFVAYYGIPLIAKGQVKGVLEIFHRAPLAAEPEWVKLLETLAGQAAIAIDNAQLFDSMQRSNLDLALAYDDTIKGWSRALDLRDKETEGHTQRVAELTEQMARAMDISEAEIVHIHRGALLHDIGKMGVPDGTLLKPGKLTDDEWVLMRKHPQLAFDMLAPITYLKPALDIPYCHHEKWDGTGYPRGLKGEQIPLAARLFAVVDVWDALTSDRPYRKAWSNEKALDHIREQAGKHFDPKAVELFLRVSNEKAHEQMSDAG